MIGSPAEDAIRDVRGAGDLKKVTTCVNHGDQKFTRNVNYGSASATYSAGCSLDPIATRMYCLPSNI
jgi:hypothetical protein